MRLMNNYTEGVGGDMEISHKPFIQECSSLWFCFSASKISSGIKTMTKLYTLKPLTGTDRKC